MIKHYIKPRSEQAGKIYEVISNLGTFEIVLYTNYSNVTFKELIVCENGQLVNYSSSSILDSVVNQINQKLDILKAVRVIPFEESISHFMDNVKVQIKMRLNKHLHIRNQFSVSVTIRKEDCILLVGNVTDTILVDRGLIFSFKEDELYMADSWQYLKEFIHTTYNIPLNQKDVDYADLGSVIDMVHL